MKSLVILALLLAVTVTPEAFATRYPDLEIDVINDTIYGFERSNFTCSKKRTPVGAKEFNHRQRAIFRALDLSEATDETPSRVMEAEGLQGIINFRYHVTIACERSDTGSSGGPQPSVRKINADVHVEGILGETGVVRNISNMRIRQRWNP